MGLNDDITLLSRVALFESFNEEQLRLLAFSARRIIKRAGEEIYLQNALSDGGYIIVEGQVDLVVREGRQEIVLGSYFANSLIGEMALVTLNRRIATAVARTGCELLFIDRATFRRMLEEFPELAARLHEQISQSVNGMLSRLTEIQEKIVRIPDLASNDNVGQDRE